MCKTIKLSKDPYKVKKTYSKCESFLMETRGKDTNKSREQWTPTNKLNCFQTKQSSVRKQYKGTNIPSFNVHIWKPDKGKDVSSVSQKVNIQDPQSEVFKKNNVFNLKINSLLAFK